MERGKGEKVVTERLRGGYESHLWSHHFLDGGKGIVDRRRVLLEVAKKLIVVRSVGIT